jgi:hypothetical protein
MRACVENRDGSTGWSDRAAAYKHVMPLAWRQLLKQAETFAIVVDSMHDAGLEMPVREVRRSEDLNGKLQLRLPEPGTDEGDDSSLTFQERFCALTKNIFMIFANERSVTPDEIICLEFATVTANRSWSHAFNIATPMLNLELRASDDTTLERWTDAIFALQCSDTFNGLVPQGMRKQHLFSRILGSKGGSMAMRLLGRTNRGDQPHIEYAPTASIEGMSAIVEPDGVGFELSSMIKDPKLGALLQSYAEETGQASELNLYTKVNEALAGSDIEVLEANEIAQLPQTEKKQLLRMSNNNLKTTPSNEGEDQTCIQEAYDQASSRLIGELLPRFCETEGFKAWLAQQQDDERTELQLMAAMQSPVGYAAIFDQIIGQPEQHSLEAAIEIETLLASSTLESPGLPLAKAIVTSYFMPGRSPKLVSVSESRLSSRLLMAMEEWTSDVDDQTKRLQALSAFQSMLVVELRPAILVPFTALKETSAFSRVLTDMASFERTKVALLHWLHTPAGFDVMREWMAERRASESVDFIADVMKYKTLEDVAFMKDNAGRIFSKYIAEGAVAEVSLPNDIVGSIRQGLTPKFPSDVLFDDAVEYIVGFLNQELWNDFTAEGVYRNFSPQLDMALGLGTSPPMLIVIRWAGCCVRRAALLSKRVVTIGSSNCDIITVEAGTMHTLVLDVDLMHERHAAMVSMLWSALPQRARESRASNLSTASSSVCERARTNTFVRHTPKLVKYGDIFMAGDYEVMLLPYHM